MSERSADEVTSGIESATQAQPFMISKTELVAHLEANDRTNCGGYSTVEHENGRRFVGWDYACQD
jgi:hypothetical protein